MALKVKPLPNPKSVDIVIIDAIAEKQHFITRGLKDSAEQSCPQFYYKFSRAKDQTFKHKCMVLRMHVCVCVCVCVHATKAGLRIVSHASYLTLPVMLTMFPTSTSQFIYARKGKKKERS